MYWPMIYRLLSLVSSHHSWPPMTLIACYRIQHTWLLHGNGLTIIGDHWSLFSMIDSAVVSSHWSTCMSMVICRVVNEQVEWLSSIHLICVKHSTCDQSIRADIAPNICLISHQLWAQSEPKCAQIRAHFIQWHNHSIIRNVELDWKSNKLCVIPMQTLISQFI